jgi:hypothetical protein
MAALQERRLGYHSRASLEHRTSAFLTQRINHYATRGIRNERARAVSGTASSHLFDGVRLGGVCCLPLLLPLRLERLRLSTCVCMCVSSFLCFFARACMRRLLALSVSGLNHRAGLNHRVVGLNHRAGLNHGVVGLNHTPEPSGPEP